MPRHKHMQRPAEERELRQKLEIQMQKPVSVNWELLFGGSKRQGVGTELIASRRGKKQLGMQVSAS